MNEKYLLSRIAQKHDIETNWNNSPDFIPMRGELIVYDIDANYDYERLKIGDGATTVVNLPFYLADEIDTIKALVGDTSVSTQISNAIESEVFITVDDIDTICGDLSLDVNTIFTNFSVTDDGQGNVFVTRQEV